MNNYQDPGVKKGFKSSHPMVCETLLSVGAVILASFSQDVFATTGVSSLNALTAPIYLLVFLSVMILLTLNYYVYKKVENKLVWLIPPIIISLLYLLVNYS